MAVIQYYITLWYIKLDFCYGKKLLVNPQGVDLGMYEAVFLMLRVVTRHSLTSNSQTRHSWT